ncbi:MAG TPA: YcxB family protein [Thermoanaerobaculia bacterium]|nr:YcxB family protein [Thermoanaerobaculia bacterium]
MPAATESSDELRVEFTLTPEEARAALAEHFGSARRKRVLRLWFLIGLLLCLPFGLAALDISRPEQLVTPARLCLLAWLIALPIAFPIVHRLWGRLVPPLLLEPTTVTLSESGFTVARTHFAGRGVWPYFTSWRELKACFALAQAPSSVLLIPKRALDPQQAEALRALLHRQLPG